ncbi:hypothetical protein EMIHUDRAFT_435083, partial [Emiliania huxleyi CCMP1516]|uniref:Uncharacterized protein n=2 Tax=Emiliania huxleyi TaxID=2903 RepID=A0A0D3JSL5_EMIH1
FWLLSQIHACRRHRRCFCARLLAGPDAHGGAGPRAGAGRHGCRDLAPRPPLDRRGGGRGCARPSGRLCGWRCVEEHAREGLHPAGLACVAFAERRRRDDSLGEECLQDLCGGRLRRPQGEEAPLQGAERAGRQGGQGGQGGRLVGSAGGRQGVCGAGEDHQGAGHGQGRLLQPEAAPQRGRPADGGDRGSDGHRGRRAVRQHEAQVDCPTGRPAADGRGVDSRAAAGVCQTEESERAGRDECRGTAPRCDCG